jgi:hypothetical protein
LLLEAVEGDSDGGVVQPGVDIGHSWTGVSEDALHDVLGDAAVDQSCPEGVTELVGADGDGQPGLVA